MLTNLPTLGLALSLPHSLTPGWEEDMYHPVLQTCRAFQPDVIVADMVTLAAHDVAESLKLPLALLGSMPLSLALDLTGIWKVMN
jgi:hypothetical protein